MIEASRADVETNYLMDFDDDRFIKLPIDGYMDLLGITPNTSQNAIINAVNNPKYRLSVLRFLVDRVKLIYQI